jgi:hypothetical protein
VADTLAEQDVAAQQGRKVFFLYPHSVLNEDLLVEILSQEYEVYSLRDHEAAAQIAAKFAGSIFFVNKDETLRESRWESWIRRLMSQKATATARVGIMTYNPDPEVARKYLMEVGIPCGYIQLKLGTAEGKAIILKTLAANEARGRRQFVRARCTDQRKASFNVTVRGAHLTGQILDISVAGMSIRFDMTVPLRPHEVLDDIQLRLRGTLCRLGGTFAGALHGGADRFVLMFRAPLSDDVRAKIHRFIFLSLQEEMDEFIRTLKPRSA